MQDIALSSLGLDAMACRASQLLLPNGPLPFAASIRSPSPSLVLLLAPPRYLRHTPISRLPKHLQILGSRILVQRKVLFGLIHPWRHSYFNSVEQL